MSIVYDIGMGKDENFVVGEDCFDSHLLGKCEAIMCQGNGYMGVRNTMEEGYLYQTRGCFVAGTFNKFDGRDVTELPNVPDVLGMKMLFDGDEFELQGWKTKDYIRTLNLRTGLSERKVLAEDKRGRRIQLHFMRFVSMDDMHLIAQKVYVTALDEDMDFMLSTGIDGQMTNSSVQHFSEGEKRLLDGRILRADFTTTQSGIDFIINCIVNIDGASSQVRMDRRKVWSDFRTVLKKGETLGFEKISTIHTSRDIDAKDSSMEEIKNASALHIKELAEIGFDKLLERSADAFDERIWKRCDVKVQSANPFDQLALRFAIYHLNVMAPVHDDRMGIAAKGLSGEGYKGHAFWDTEIFCFPFFLYGRPEAARSLLKYRYNCLPGARKKAGEGGYKGAQYPWESAWIDDGEVTPVWGAADIVTGEPMKIWSGFIEIHITGVVAYAVEQYYNATDDLEFMKEAGFQIVFETALFWTSRLEYNSELDRYEINDVVGPDEYKEHANNNAFTNYMVHRNLELALRYYNMIKTLCPDVCERLQREIGLDAIIDEVHDKIDKVYLPQPREDQLIPQDDTYLELREIDLTPFKNQRRVGEIFDHYNLSQVNKIQVSKQADILILMLLMEEKFSREVVRKNYDYYEARTLHDSSLSLSTHCILAKKMDDMELAYGLFGRSARIDLGPDMNTSDQGIHSAAMGGIWQCAVFGFAGIRTNGDTLEISPRLPAAWESLSFYYSWKGRCIHFQIEQDNVRITPEDNGGGEAPTRLQVNGEAFLLKEEPLIIQIG